MIHYNACPACGSMKISEQFIAKDHTTSGETFQVWECETCTIRFTQDVPDEMSIGEYYKSESYISHTETRKGLINNLYHYVRKKTLTGKAALIIKETGQRQGRLLDIGAGTGAFSAHMKGLGWKVTALEPDAEAREKAKTLYKLEAADVAKLFSLPDATYHAISMWHVLEHVHDLHGYLEQIKRLIGNEGKAFIAVPNYTAYDAAHYKKYWAAYDVPRHLYHFSPASMKSLVHKHGLKLEKIYPMWYDSFYVSMLSEQYMKGSASHFSAILTGLNSNAKALFDREKASSLIYILSSIRT